MSDTQPEALLQRLEMLGQDSVGNYGMPICREAAAELRRLHEVNAELVDVLQDIRDNYDCDEDAHKYGSRCRSCVARAAIAKATGEQQ